MLARGGLGLLLVLAACESRPELPDPATRLVARKLPQYSEWVRTEDELRSMLTAPQPGDEHTARLLAKIGDSPGALEAWRSVSRLRSGDIHAIYHVADLLEVLGDDRGALEAVAAAGPTSSNPHVARADLDSLRCAALRRLGQVSNARAACDAGVGGVQVMTARRRRAMLHLAIGETTSALGDARWLVDHAGEAATSWFLLGAALDASGEQAEAREAWETALRLVPGHEPSHRALAGLDPTPADKMAAQDAWVRSDTALDLAVCGHIYLDLGLASARAERCFAASERLGPGHAESHRIWHLAETDRSAALARGEAALSSSRSAAVLLTVGWLRHSGGDDRGAKQLLEEAVRLEPRNYQANVNLAKVCEDLDDDACADAAYSRALGDPGTGDVLLAVALFAGALVPLGLSYAWIRKRFIRRLSVARAREVR